MAMVYTTTPKWFSDGDLKNMHVHANPHIYIKEKKDETQVKKC